jgi:hypothetical protein
VHKKKKKRGGESAVVFVAEGVGRC